MKNNEIIEKNQRKYKFIFLSGFALSVIVSILEILFLNIEIKGYIIFLSFFGINIIFILITEKYEKQYQLEFKKILKEILNNHFTNVKYLENQNSNKTVENSNLFLGMNIKTSNLIQAEYNNIPIEIIETKIEENIVMDNARGLPENSKNVVFNGQIYHFSFNKNNLSKFDIISKYFLQRAFIGEERNVKEYKKESFYSDAIKEVDSTEFIEMNKLLIENEEYSNWFDIYSNDKIDINYINEKILPLLLNIKKYFNEKLFLIVQQNDIYFGINGYINGYSGEILKFKDIDTTKNNLNEYFNEIKKLFDALIEWNNI